MSDRRAPPRLRSVLYMPADRARAFEKARELPADALIFDLEDAVAPEAKATARAVLKAQLASGGFGNRYRVVRINALSSEWSADDLACLAETDCDALLAPKIDSADDVRALAAAMSALPAGTALWAMIETPAAILALREIAACAADTPLAAFVLGLNDLAKDSGIAQVPGRAAYAPVLTMSVLAARAHGLFAIDGVCNALDDDDRLTAECEQARACGFDGKTLIHPRQVAIANRVFAASEAEISEAEAIVAAFADPANAGKGAIRVNGAMVERLHLAQAERLLGQEG